MHQRLFALLILLCACSAQAAENPTPLPRASSTSTQATAKPTLRRLPAPTMSVMRVTRQPDGTLATDCVQRPNPKAHAQKQAAPQ
jgi:hypothetical protein